MNYLGLSLENTFIGNVLMEDDLKVEGNLLVEGLIEFDDLEADNISTDKIKTLTGGGDLKINNSADTTIASFNNDLSVVFSDIISDKVETDLIEGLTIGADIKINNASATQIASFNNDLSTSFNGPVKTNTIKTLTGGGDLKINNNTDATIIKLNDDLSTSFSGIIKGTSSLVLTDNVPNTIVNIASGVGILTAGLRVNNKINCDQYQSQSFETSLNPRMLLTTNGLTLRTDTKIGVDINNAGDVKISNAYTLPSTSGSVGQALEIKSPGFADWVTLPSISNLVQDEIVYAMDFKSVTPLSSVTLINPGSTALSNNQWQSFVFSELNNFPNVAPDNLRQSFLYSNPPPAGDVGYAGFYGTSSTSPIFSNGTRDRPLTLFGGTQPANVVYLYKDVVVNNLSYNKLKLRIGINTPSGASSLPNMYLSCNYWDSSGGTPVDTPVVDVQYSTTQVNQVLVNFNDFIPPSEGNQWGMRILQYELDLGSVYRSQTRNVRIIVGFSYNTGATTQFVQHPSTNINGYGMGISRLQLIGELVSSGAGTLSTDHTLFSNLTTGDAGHTQFTQLTGRTGGQTISGGTITGQELVLQSNSAVPTNGDIKCGSRFNAQNNDIINVNNQSASKVLLSDGTAVAPSITFTSDTDTGIYRDIGDVMGLTTGGTTRMYITNTTIEPRIQVATTFTGTQTTPAYSFNGDNNTGIYRVSAGVFGITTAGASRMTMDNDLTTLTNKLRVINGNLPNDVNIRMSGGSNTGFYNTGGSGGVGISINGTTRAIFASTGVVSLVGFSPFTTNLHDIGTTSLNYKTAFVRNINNTTIGNDLNIGNATDNTIMGGRLRIPDGTAPLPSLSFTSDTDTGIYSFAPNSLGFATGGVARMRIDSSGITNLNDIRPNITNIYDIGTNVASFRSLYAQSVNPAPATIVTALGNSTSGCSMPGTLALTATIASDNLTLVKTNSSSSWQINAGRTSFFDNWLLFRNSVAGGNFALALTNTGSLRGLDASAGTPTYGFVNGSNCGMYLFASNQVGFSTQGQPRMIINAGTHIDCKLPVKLPSYVVAGVPSASTSGAGSQIYVSNESGGAVPAFSDGTNWRRVTDRAIIT